MERKAFLYIIISLCFSLSALAQEKLKIKKSDFDIDEPGLNSAWNHIRMGNKFFREGRGTYSKAVQEYQFALQYNRYNPELNYNIGVCCLYSDKKKDALGYLQKAFKFNNNVAPDIHLLLGRAYQYNYKFNEAIDSYKTYLQGLTTREKEKLDFNVDRWIQECRNGIELLQDTLRVEITNIGEKVNSVQDDFNSVISKNEKRMYFASRRPYYARPDRNYFDNKYNEDIYVSYYEGDSWGLAQNLGKTINSKYNESVLSVSPDAQKLFIYRGVKRNGDFYVSQARKDKWKSPKRYSGKLNSRSRETTLNFTEEGNKVVFVSEDKRKTVGGSDIFISEKGPKNRWEEPKNIGESINTVYDEEGVYIDSVGNTLYFSSKGHNTMGGYDIFKTTVDENGKWSKPVNLGFPINSPFDDLFYVPTKDTAVSYFSSLRDEGYGYLDIYKITYLPPPEPEIIEEPEPLVDTVVVEVIDSVEVEKPEPEPEFIIRGSVLNSKDSSPVMAKMDIIDMDINKVVGTTVSNRDNGSYSVKLMEKKDYGVEITAQGYLVFLDILEVEDDSEENEIFRNFLLKPIEVGEKVILKNIFFEFGEAVITPDSYTELGRVLKLLNTNPDLRIEISGHTDNIGSYSYNQKLSEQRTKAVVDYLVGLGIDPDRLKYAGYASSQPVATNDTEEGRAKNRRVEFKILSK